MHKYEKLLKIGEGNWANEYIDNIDFINWLVFFVSQKGTYGTVFKAKNRNSFVFFI